MKKNLTVTAIASILMIVVLRWQGAPLKSLDSPRAIVDLELADTPQRLHALLLN